MQPVYHDFSQSKMIAYDIETYDPNLTEMGPGVFRRDGYMLGFSLADESGFAEYYNVGHPDCSPAEKKKNLAYLREVMALPAIKIGTRIQYDAVWTEIFYDIPMNGVLADIAIAEALLDENLMNYDLDTMSHKYLGEGKRKGRPEQICEANGWKGDFRKHLWKMSYADVHEYGVGDAYQPIKIYQTQLKLLAAQDLIPVFDLENKITRGLIIMYRNGVCIDAKKRDVNTAACRAELEKRKAALWGAHGQFNYNSSKQLAGLLDSLGVEYPLNPETHNPVLDRHQLEKLAPQVPFVSDIIIVKKLDKILSTFLEGSLKENVTPDGRIHATYYNTKTESEGGLRGTRSGRFSCIAKGTYVETARGSVCIENIVPGDLVRTHTGKWAPVIALADQGVQDCIRLTVAQGTSIICTSDHKLFGPAGWSRASVIEEVFYVDMQKTGERPHVLPSRDGAVHSRRQANIRRCSQRVQCNSTHGGSRCEEDTASRDSPCRAGVAVLSRKAGRVEPYDDAHRGSTPELEGGLLRQQGSLHTAGRGMPILCPSHCDGQDAWDACQGSSFRAGCTSHRWERSKQRSCEFSPLYQGWSQEAAQEIQRIEERSAVGKVQVYDIVLAHDDHSFVANGYLVHNCANPNMQQIVSYDKKDEEKDPFKAWYTKLCRELFIPEEGCDWGKIDYSQIEYRFMAHFACEPGGKAVREQYNDDPYTDYHGMIEKLTGLPRKLAKNLNFGVGYGMGAKHMAEFFGWDIDYCYEMLNTYHLKAPFIKATMTQVEMLARRQGFIRTFLKRRSHLLDKKKAYTMFCRLCQGSAADLSKQAYVNIMDAGILDVLKVHVTVHDEFDFSVPRTPAGHEAFAEARHIMETALTLRVPIIAEPELGPNWADLHDFEKGVYYGPIIQG